MHVELWWEPLSVWYKGQITESRKDNNFVKILCKLKNGRFDHIWYHTEHIKFRKLKPSNELTRDSYLDRDWPTLNSSKLETNLPKTPKDGSLISPPKNNRLIWPAGQHF